jgi:transglutaminase-like putative cysteine protease
VFFLPGLLLLCGWALLATKQTRRSSLITALAIAGGLAVGGAFGLDYVYDRVLKMGSGSSQRGNESNEVQTAIGALGEVKQSPEIQWRLKPINGQPPKLLRTGSFDKYAVGNWENANARGAPKDEIFADLTTIEPVQGEVYYLLRPLADPSASGNEQSPTRDSLPRFNLRGEAANETMLPLPGDTASVRDFDLDGIEKNPLGTVRIFPKSSVIDGIVLWKSQSNPEASPDEELDLKIPPNEKQTVVNLVKELGLDQAPTVRAKLEILDDWFLQEFTYTRYLKIRPPTREQWKSAVSVFLTTNRSGHCEYFATGAAMLLREAGVPTRYAIGYSVREQDLKRGEFLIRGEHAHAWCRVWDAERNMWIDFDPTPPTWLSIEQQRRPSTQWLSDAFLRFREDFFLWRNRPRNRLAASLVMVAIGLVAAFIIGRRLWRSKHVMAEQRNAATFNGPLLRTPLHDLEEPASNILGPRPLGLPFSRWIMGLRESIAEPAKLDEAISLHQRLRFDPAPPDAPPVDRLQTLVDAIRQGLRK